MHTMHTSNYMIRYTNSTSISLADTMGCQEVDITSPYVTYNYDGVLTDEDIREFDDEIYNKLKEDKEFFLKK